jgi:glycosyltransferase involved in cell wall biosynthesis
MNIAVDAREMVGAIAGKGRYVVELIKGLAALDSANTYFLYTKAPLDIPLPKNFQEVSIGGLPGLRQLWLAMDAKRRGCAVLLAPTGYLPVIFSAIPTVVTVHDLALFVSSHARPALKTYIAERLLLGLAVRRARKVLSVSKSTSADLEKIFTVPAKKIALTLLGYDKEVYTTQAKKDGDILAHYNLNPSYLYFVGTLEPRKNITGIIQAYSQLPESLRAQYPLVIAGKKGWFYEEIFSTVTALKLEKQVHFLGRVPDEHLPALYRQAKLFLFPSYYEGFGLPPLEALACGTPVVSSSISSLPEVVGDAGLLIDPTNVDQLTLAIRRLVEDDVLYREIKQRTTAQAALFDWQNTAKETLKVLESVGKNG